MRVAAGCDLGNDRVRDVEAEGVVDARQTIDADQHEGGRGAEARGFLDGLGKRCNQMRTIELAGERVVAQQPHQLRVAGMPLIIDTDDALRARRPAVGAGEPAAGLLDPEHGGGCAGPDAIFDPIGRATARGRCMAKRVGPDRAHRLDQFCKLRAARQRRRRNIRKNRGSVIAPGNRIGCDVPHEGRLAERGQDGRSLRNGGCQNRLVSGHGWVILGPRILPASAPTLGKVHKYSANHAVRRLGTSRGQPA